MTTVPAEKLYSVCGQLKGANTLIKTKTAREVKVMTMIIKSKNIELIEEYFEGEQVAIEYYARPDVYINKRGKESECWTSAYGKYAGPRSKPKPLLKFYAKYNNKHFKPNFDTNEMEITRETFIKGGHRYFTKEKPKLPEYDTDGKYSGSECDSESDSDSDSESDSDREE